MANQVAYEGIEIMEDDDSVGEECWDLLEVRVAIYSSNFFGCRFGKKKPSIGVSSVIAIYIVYPLIMCLDFNVLFSCFVSF